MGDTSEAGGGADEASKARVRNVWIKFKELTKATKLVYNEF